MYVKNQFLFVKEKNKSFYTKFPVRNFLILSGDRCCVNFFSVRFLNFRDAETKPDGRESCSLLDRTRIGTPMRFSVLFSTYLHTCVYICIYANMVHETYEYPNGLQPKRAAQFLFQSSHEPFQFSNPFQF